VYRPRHELQKVAPRNFDAFLKPISLEKQKRQSKFLRCRREGRRFCNSRLQQGDFPFACRNQATDSKQENTP